MFEAEVQYSHHDDRLQVVVPFELRIDLALGLILNVQVPCLSALLVDRIRGVVQRPLPEMPLHSLLHLDDERAAVPGLARDVEHHLPVLVRQSKVLSGNKVHIHDVAVLQQHVQETDQHILVRLTAEEPLEHEVAEQFGISFPLQGFLDCIHI